MNGRQTETRDRLDEVIDRSAARLVSVEPDAEMVGRILERLPERRSPAARTVLAWLPQLAAAAAILVALVIWNRDPGNVPASDRLADTSPAAPAVHEARSKFEARVPQVAEAARPAPRTVIQAPRTEEARIDHERSLAFVEQPDFLTLPSIAAAAIEPQDALNVAPLVLTELPLSGESNSPH